ncbi:hypothetical protein WN944_024913 [Citrus x changshan-huyou]|uniref:Uncharacterized protein n=1 Tax=Citrus x changshan-huyou TaxID=2935761 RepID=A0AAP0QCG7_9ROSI
MQQRHSGNFSDTIWRQFFQSPAKACALLGFILVLLLGTLVSTRLLDSIVSNPPLVISPRTALLDRKFQNVVITT